MAAWLPLPSGFTGYATRFVDPALGFSLGWNYWFKVSGNDDLIYKATARLREIHPMEGYLVSMLTRSSKVSLYG
jgi:hypothetical protein